jgi:hypothetical protein
LDEFMGRWLRIGALFFVLLVVGREAWLARSRTTEWREPLRVVIYPLNADGSAASDAYLSTLRRDIFTPIVDFTREQAQAHRLALRSPVELYLAPRIDAAPPLPPSQASAPEIMLWSLQLRFWAWRHDAYDGPKPHVRLFVSYFAPVANRHLAHSVGLQKGLVALVNAFASAGQEGSNNVVIAHELLHTFGATDKYDPATSQPVFPEGYAEPDANPRHPQRMAEIMAGRIPISPSNAETPRDLDEVVIGTVTAREINWVK